MSGNPVELASLSQVLPAALANQQPLKIPQIRTSRTSSLQGIEHSDPIEIVPDRNPSVSKGGTAAIIASVTCITGIGSFLAGVVTVALPVIAIDLRLDKNVLLWYARPLIGFFSFYFSRLRSKCCVNYDTLYLHE